MGLTTRYTRLLEVARNLKQNMSLYGYTLIDTPVIDHADLFLTKAGDQIIERLFTFQRSGRQLSLRPEFTAGAASHYVKQDNNHVARWQFQGMVFEDDPSDFAQDRQKFSIGAELIGASETAADAEIIAMAVHGIQSLNIDGWTLKIGNMGLMRHLLSTYVLDTYTQQFILNRRYLLRQDKREMLEAAISAYIQTGSDSTIPPDAGEELNTRDMVGTVLDATQRNRTMGGRTQEDIARRLIRKRQQAAQFEQIQSAIDFLEKCGEMNGEPAVVFQSLDVIGSDDVSHRLIDDWKYLITLLNAYGIPTDNIILQPDLAHNWDYYTGMVFEIALTDGRRLCSGGRYDELTELISGKAVPAVGFAYIAENIVTEVGKTELVTVRLHTDDVLCGIQWSSLLRNSGIPVRISTGNDAHEHELIITVDTDNHAHFGSNTYDIKDVDALISEIENYAG